MPDTPSPAPAPANDDTGGTVLPLGTACITRPAPDTDLLQVAIRHPQLGWIAVELDRHAASKLAQELQAFADFRATGDGDA